MDIEQTPPRKRKVTRFLLTGLATLLPAVLTGYIVVAIYHFVERNLGQWLAERLAWIIGYVRTDPSGRTVADLRPWIIAAGNVLAVVIVLGAAIVVGALAGSFIGRRVIRAGELFILRIPFIRVVYPYVKQVTDFVFSEKKVTFRKVVAVPYPRKEVYAIGFVTGQGWRTINERTGQDMVQVFIPSSPTPVTGYVAFVPREDVIELPITVDEALRFSISGGVIVPPQQLLPPPGAPGADGEEEETTEPEQPAWARRE